jgi:hypothetical protein
VGGRVHAPYAGGGEPQHYDVDGSVSLGGDLMHADVPFHLSGALTHDDLVRTTLNSLPRIVP